MTVEYPADTAQPADLWVPLCKRGMNDQPCRSFAEAVRDISKRRDLPEWVWPELQHHRHSAVIIELAAERAARRRKR